MVIPSSAEAQNPHDSTARPISGADDWGDRQRIEAAWKIRSDQQDTIKYADQKLVMMMTLSAILSGFALSNHRTLIDAGPLLHVMGVLFLAATLALIHQALRVITTRTPSSEANPGSPNDNLPRVIYFGHITKRASPNVYFEEFSHLSELGLLRDLAHQNWELGGVADQKYKHLGRAMHCLAAQLALFVILFFALAGALPSANKATPTFINSASERMIG